MPLPTRVSFGLDRLGSWPGDPVTVDGHYVDASADLAIANAFTDVMGKPWRPRSIAPTDCMFRLDDATEWGGGWGSASRNLFDDFQHIGLVHRMVEGSAWRIRSNSKDFGPEFATPAALPSAISDKTNLGSGSYTDIDEDPESPDSNWVSPGDTTLDTDFLVSFDLTTATSSWDAHTELLGYTASTHDTQVFKAWVKATGSGTPQIAIRHEDASEALNHPKLVYCGTGASNAGVDSATAEVTSTTGVLLIWMWNPGDLVAGSKDGTGVGARVDITSDGTESIELGALRWYAPINSVRSGGGTPYDSGLIDLYDTLSDITWGDLSIQETFSGTNFLSVDLLGGAASGTYGGAAGVAVEIYPKWENNIGVETGDFTGEYFEVERIVAGPVYTPSNNMAFGWSMGWADHGVVTQTDAGGSFYRRRFRKRTLDFSLENLDRGEIMQNVMLMAGSRGQGPGISIVPIPDATEDKSILNLYGRLAADIRAVNTTATYYNADLSFVEW